MANTKKEYYKTHDGSNKGKTFSESSREKMSLAKRAVNKWKGEDNPRHKQPLKGEKNGRWKGGILDTYLELRSEIKDWADESMKFCKYKCVLTGGDFDNVHHTTAFRDIVDEVFKKTQIAIKSKVRDYSVEEFDILRTALKELHELYGHGACISKDMHKLFHDIYGYTKFSPYDFLDFVYRLDCGEFDDFLLQQQIQLNINYEYITYLEGTLIQLKSA